jgi:hypothetical protein
LSWAQEHLDLQVAWEVPKRSTGDPCFSSSESSEQAKFFCRQPRSNHKENQQSSGFQCCQIAWDLARRAAPIVQEKSGSSDPIGTGGSQSAYQRSVFQGTGSSQLIALGSVDQQNTESTFRAEPAVLAPGHVKRACKWGSPLYNNEYDKVWRVWQEVCLGGSPVPFLLREAMSSLQFTRRTYTRQVNIQRVQLPLAWAMPN